MFGFSPEGKSKEMIFTFDLFAFSISFAYGFEGAPLMLYPSKQSKITSLEEGEKFV